MPQDHGKTVSGSSEGWRVSAALTLDELEAVSSLQAEIWGAPRMASPVSLLRAIADSGGIVLLATAGARPVGFVFGFTGRTPEGFPYHRSHAAGVVADLRNSGIGTALKQAQRRAVLDVGMDRIIWTFDPSQRRNANFNFGRLGVVSRRFRRDYYGRRSDALSGGLPTDRLFVEWLLGTREQEELLRLRSCAPVAAVAIPDGLIGGAGQDRTRMLQLHEILRERLESALARGLYITDFDADSSTYRLAQVPSWISMRGVSPDQ